MLSKKPVFRFAFGPIFPGIKNQMAIAICQTISSSTLENLHKLPKRTVDHHDALLVELQNPEEAAHYANSSSEDSEEIRLVALRDIAEAHAMKKPTKNPHAVALGRAGGKIGGKVSGDQLKSPKGFAAMKLRDPERYRKMIEEREAQRRVR